MGRARTLMTLPWGWGAGQAPTSHAAGWFPQGCKGVDASAGPGAARRGADAKQLAVLGEYPGAKPCSVILIEAECSE